MRVTKTTATTCPHCHRPLNAASHLGGATPSPGDFTICITCTKLAVFTDTLDLRLPTADELALAEQLDDVQCIVTALRAVHARRMQMPAALVEGLEGHA